MTSVRTLRVPQRSKSYDHGDQLAADATEAMEEATLTEADLMEAFKVFDKDGDGVLSREELKRALGDHVSEDDIDSIFEEFDANGDGVLQFEEMAVAWAEMGIPVPKKAAPEVPPAAVQPADPLYWGITVQQLYDFYVECYGEPDRSKPYAPTKFFEDVQDGPTMYETVMKFVKPKTAGTGLSLACLLNMERPLRATHFVSHSWGETFANFVMLLCFSCLPDHTFAQPGEGDGYSTREATQAFMGIRTPLPPETVLWVCSLGINQNADIGGELGSDVLASPFALALKGCEQFVVIQNLKVALYSRVWCCLEAYLALKRREDHPEFSIRTFGMGMVEASDRLMADGAPLCHANRYRSKLLSPERDEEANALEEEERAEGTSAERKAELKLMIEEILHVEVKQAYVDKIRHVVRTNSEYMDLLWDVRAASASVEQDRVDILRTIEADVEEVNRLVNDFAAEGLAASMYLHTY